MRNVLLLFVLIALFPGMNAQYLHHKIDASINHSTNEISVTDTLVFPPGFMTENSPLIFTLNRNLSVEVSSRDFMVEKLNGPEHSNSDNYQIMVNLNRSGEVKVPVRYSGKIEEKIEAGATEYARGFSTTDGIISPDGIYLAGSTVWIPAFENAELFTFNLTVDLDEPWNVVSQGTRSKNNPANGRRIVQYNSPDPVDEVFLIAGKWTEYAIQTGDVLVQAFLRSPDEALANRYLKVTSHYLEFYRRLIGEYPYTKFALVENFWETGYGMPSFTLLGEKVIRFPWILHSSYPHELLHNYWGNSVYVDYSTGNWCEGITAYMADHLIKEQQGVANEYRRNTLQKFTDYVNEENDFPPAEFISRNNPAEEAIGYGKVLMFNNILREEFGDEVFTRAYSDFYAKNKFKFASFDDIRICFEEITNQDLKPMFDQWITRKGAPSIELSNVEVTEANDQYELTFSLRQLQQGELFNLNIPVAIWLENSEEVQLTKESMEERKTTCSYQFNSRPLKISVDPQFNMMRTLHRSEVPSTLSQLFGAKNAVMIIPRASEISEDYLTLAESWKETQAAQGKELKILFDTDLEEIPSDRAVWVIGFENRHYDQGWINEQYNDFLTQNVKEKISSLIHENSLVYAIPNNNNPEQTIGFIGTGHPNALKGLSRKLFHYGSYGYLGFEGDAPDNVLKGVFPILNSQLEHVISYPDHPRIKQKLNNRKALGHISPEVQHKELKVWNVSNVEEYNTELFVELINGEVSLTF